MKSQLEHPKTLWVTSPSYYLILVCLTIVGFTLNLSTVEPAFDIYALHLTLFLLTLTLGVLNIVYHLNFFINLISFFLYASGWFFLIKVVTAITKIEVILTPLFTNQPKGEIASPLPFPLLYLFILGISLLYSGILGNQLGQFTCSVMNFCKGKYSQPKQKLHVRPKQSRA